MSLMLLLLDLQIRRLLESKKRKPGKGYKEASRCSHTLSNRSRNHAVVEMKNHEASWFGRKKRGWRRHFRRL